MAGHVPMDEGGGGVHGLGEPVHGQDKEEPPLRRPHSSSRAQTTAPPPDSQTNRRENSTPLRDILWAYEPLDPHVKRIQFLLQDDPEILEAIQKTYTRVVELVRSRPCKVPGSTLPCLGKIDIPVRPVSRSRRHVSVHTLRPSVDTGTWTGDTTLDALTQTDQTVTVNTETQTETTDTPTTPRPTQATDTITGTQTGTMAPASPPPATPQPHRPPANDATPTATPTAPTTAPAATTSTRPEDWVGWRTIEGRDVYINAPRPGCWACGRPDHRAPRCPDRRRYNHRYCYRCGLGNVTVKECPIHGEEWRARGPFVPSRGTNVPRDQLPPTQ